MLTLLIFCYATVTLVPACPHHPPPPSCKYIAGTLGLAESCTTRVIPTSIATLHSSHNWPWQINRLNDAHMHILSLAICAYAKLIFMKSYYNVQISYLFLMHEESE